MHVKKSIICDIDGTVADLEHRRSWIQSNPKNWKAFYANVENDLPIQPVIDIVVTLWNSGWDIVFCSGREEIYREKTEKWLREHVIPPKNLYMRKKGDYRDDAVVKIELLEQIRADGFNPLIAFDDRNRVVDAWRANGIICAQVAPGDF
jgi:predicted secreted acid phosphatase